METTEAPAWNAPRPELLEVLRLRAQQIPSLPSADPARCEIDRKDLLIDRSARLGRGSYAEVSRAVYLGQPLAAKEIFVTLPEAAVRDIQHELGVQCSLRHERLVQPKLFCTREAPLCIAMEAMDTSLQRVLRDRAVDLPLLEGVRLMREVCEGLAFLHAFGVAHRDLKSSNVLLSWSKTGYTARLSDAAVSAIVRAAAPPSETPGSLPWTAPEVLAGGPCTAASDVYSFATVCCEVLTRRAPYDGLSPAQIASALAAAPEGRAARHPIPADCPEQLYELLLNCWHRDPAARPSAPAALAALQSIEARLQGAQHAVISGFVSGYVQSAPVQGKERDERLCQYAEDFARTGRPRDFIEAFVEGVRKQIARESGEHRVLRMLPDVVALWARFLAQPSQPGPAGGRTWPRGALREAAAAAFDLPGLTDGAEFGSFLANAGLPSRDAYPEAMCRQFVFWLCPAALVYRGSRELFEEAGGRTRLGNAFMTLEEADAALRGAAAGTFVLRLSRNAWPNENAGRISMTFKRSEEKGVQHARLQGVTAADVRAELHGAVHGLLSLYEPAPSAMDHEASNYVDV
eukprot:tig00021582_g22617.t1